MAIQLSERDMMIFKFIEEHHVLLEKHIAWFISCDEKPVLIRDRLRKLFYLDYLLCQRHGGKLPWWSTPTKPLVYMLSPLARTVASAEETELDLADSEIQRHLLEIANLRMLFLMEQKTGLISDFSWKTQPGSENAVIAAAVEFVRNNSQHKIAIINQPSMPTEEILAAVESSINATGNITICIISKDDASQDLMQKALAKSAHSNRLAFVTHQEIYKSGIVKSKWQSVNKQYISIISDAVVEPISWNSSLATA